MEGEEQKKLSGRGLQLVFVLGVWFHAAFSSFGGKSAVKTLFFFSSF